MGKHQFAAPKALALRAIAVASLTALGALTAVAPAQAGQVRVSVDTRVQDLGLASTTDVKSIAISLTPNNLAGLEAFVASTADRNSPNFRQFLTPAQFAAQYGQSDAVVAQVRAYLESMGMTVTKVYANNLLISARATNAQIAAAFGTPVHQFSYLGQSYQAPTAAPVLPQQIAGAVSAITGLSNKPVFKSHRVAIPNVGPAGAEATAVAGVTPTPNVASLPRPGSYTTRDLALQYNINPLYAAGVSGAGKTIGIATLADFDPNDAFTYWQAIGLNVDPNRITKVAVDGGALPADGVGSDGAGETTLDVEQSGGVAPGANVRVYVAPNTDAGFLDVFAQAVNDNIVDTLSISWGGPEIGSDGKTLAAFHTVFLQAAAQGIPVIAAAGDAGAYDINRNPGAFVFPSQATTLLDVDFPAADPLVVAAGGTTLPGVYHRKHGDITVPAERPWGWDYLRDYITTWYGQATYYAYYFPVGGGGGVSVQFNQPFYQAGLPGVLNSAPAQSLWVSPAVNGTKSWQDWADLPSGFAGRNLPDLALNADPVSGYAIYQGGWGFGSGGTSFVAPQLNGIFTLIAQGAGGRLGFLHPQLYGVFKAQGYGPSAAFRPITTGSNLFYRAGPNYNPASGLGSLDVANLARAFGALPSGQ